MFHEPQGERCFTSSESGITNTMLAAALAAIGIPFDDHRAFSQVHGDGISSGGRTTWYFQEKSECGKYSTAELIRAWDDREWHAMHPDHPFAYIKCAFENHSRLVDKLKQDTPLGLVRKRGKIALVSLAASQRTQDLIFKRLK